MPTAVDMYYFLSAQLFGSTHVPKVDLTGKTIIVTGANTGLGFDACKHLARMGVSHLILACRNAEKGEKAKQAIYQEIGCKDKTKIEVWSVDLDSFESVKAFTARVRTQLKRLDGVVANAGIELNDFELSESTERTLTVNVISTFLLCLGVLPKLCETAKIHNVHTNLSLVGSCVHYFGPDTQLHAIPSNEDIFTGLSNPKISKFAMRYPLSKLLEEMRFHELATHYKDPNVVMTIVNPGWCGTELTRYRSKSLGERVMFRLMGRTSEQGSRTLVHGVVAGRELHGKYLSECQEGRLSAYMQSSRGKEMEQRVWKDLLGRLRKIDSEVVGKVIA